MLENIKNLFTANKEKEEDIVKTMSDVYSQLHPPKGGCLTLHL